MGYISNFKLRLFTKNKLNPTLNFLCFNLSDILVQVDNIVKVSSNINCKIKSHLLNNNQFDYLNRPTIVQYSEMELSHGLYV